MLADLRLVENRLGDAAVVGDRHARRGAVAECHDADAVVLPAPDERRDQVLRHDKAIARAEVLRGHAPRGVERDDDVDAVAVAGRETHHALRPRERDDQQQQRERLERKGNRGGGGAQAARRSHERQGRESERAEAVAAIAPREQDAYKHQGCEREPQRIAESRHDASSSARDATSSKSRGGAPSGENFSMSPWRRMSTTTFSRWSSRGTSSVVVSSLPRFARVSARYARVASASAAHRSSCARASATARRKRSCGVIAGSITCTARRARYHASAHVAIASSAAMAMAMNGERGYGIACGGVSGAGFRSSPCFSTDRTGTMRLRKRTPPVTPLSANGRGVNVRTTTVIPCCDTSSYAGDGSSFTGAANVIVIRSPTVGAGGEKVIVTAARIARIIRGVDGAR